MMEFYFIKFTTQIEDRKLEERPYIPWRASQSLAGGSEVQQTAAAGHCTLVEPSRGLGPGIDCWIARSASPQNYLLKY